MRRAVKIVTIGIANRLVVKALLVGIGWMTYIGHFGYSIYNIIAIMNTALMKIYPTNRDSYTKFVKLTVYLRSVKVI